MDMNSLFSNPLFGLGVGLLANSRSENPVAPAFNQMLQMQAVAQQKELQGLLMDEKRSEIEERNRRRQLEEQRGRMMREAIGAYPEMMPPGVEGPPQSGTGYLGGEYDVGGLLGRMGQIPGMEGEALSGILQMNKPRNPMVVSPGGALVDPGGQELYRAQFKPDQTLVEVHDPSSPTGTRFVPRSQAIGMSGKPPTSWGVEVGPDGSVRMTQGRGSGLTNSMQTDVQKKVMKGMQDLRELRGISDAYSGKYLTYQGKAKAAGARILDKAEMLPEGGGEYLTGATNLFNRANQFFNLYRKEITGAAAALAELDRLQASFLHGSMGPTEFKASLDLLLDKAESELAANRSVLQGGLLDHGPQDSAGGGMADPMGIRQ